MVPEYCIRLRWNSNLVLLLSLSLHCFDSFCFAYLPCVEVTVTRLIRVSFGDYNLDKIPPGMAIEVPIKEIEKQKRKGPLFFKKTRPSAKAKTAKKVKDGQAAAPVQWVRTYR